MSMKKNLAPGVLASLFLALPASALTAEDAQRCQSIVSSLPVQQSELMAMQDRLLALQVAAETAGDTYEEAQKLSALSDAYQSDAAEKAVLFRESQAEVARLNAELQERAARFNEDADWYNRVCVKD